MSNSCSACGSSLSGGKFTHPILNVPVCVKCNSEYHSGEFTMQEGNEIYCRWCGEGEGSLLLCDSCPKGFCSRCIQRNFGKIELQRIQTMSDRWNCLICSPEPFYDLCKKNGWNVERIKSDSSARKLKAPKGVVYADISKGREKYELPVVNEVDDAPPPLDFIYINKPVWGGSASFTDNPNDLQCCSCTDGCVDPAKCECLRRTGGAAYNAQGILTMGEATEHVYECNPRCACHISQCRNRLVTHGPHLRLEVFRCANTGKGWGVRCRTDIQAGTYVADYIGEILVESEGERRGLTACDEYLFNLDYFGRSRAAQRIAELGLADEPKLFDDSGAGSSEPNITCLSREDLLRHLDRGLVDRMCDSGAVDRALGLGKRLRDDPESYLAELDRRLSHGAAAALPVVAPSSSSSSAAVGGSKARSGGSALVRGQQQSGKVVGGAFQHKGTGGSKSIGNSSSNSSSESGITSSTDSRAQSAYRSSWAENQLRLRARSREQARNVLTDRVVIETEARFDTYLFDARWCGNIGRFFNHACSPNMQIVSVFCGDTQDVKVPRIAFFAADFIPARTELCYDYGYFPGNVEGKAKACLCGTADCRKKMY